MEIAKIRELLADKPDAIIVGSAALWLLGIQDKKPQDLDIVALTIKGLAGRVIAYNTDSPFSKSGVRAYSIVEGEKIDIFVEMDLPEHIKIQGLRVQTPTSMLNYYRELLPKAREHWQQGIKNKIKIITSWMDKI